MISNKNNAIAIFSITFGTNSASCVPDELPLGHLVLDVGRAQVDGEEDQGEAHHVSVQVRIKNHSGFRYSSNNQCHHHQNFIYNRQNHDKGDLHGVNGHGQRWVALAEANLLVIIILFLI